MGRPTRPQGRSGAVWSLAWRTCRASCTVMQLRLPRHLIWGLGGQAKPASPHGGRPGGPHVLRHVAGFASTDRHVSSFVVARRPDVTVGFDECRARRSWVASEGVETAEYRVVVSSRWATTSCVSRTFAGTRDTPRVSHARKGSDGTGDQGGSPGRRVLRAGHGVCPWTEWRASDATDAQQTRRRARERILEAPKILERPGPPALHESDHRCS